MNENNIFSRLKRKYKVTTYSNQNLNIAPTLLRQHFNVEEPNKVCVGNLMYIGTDECWLYLVATVVDFFNIEGVGLVNGFHNN